MVYTFNKINNKLQKLINIKMKNLSFLYHAKRCICKYLIIIFLFIFYFLYLILKFILVPIYIYCFYKHICI